MRCRKSGCERRAVFFIKAWSKKSQWENYRCEDHVSSLFKAKVKIIRKHKQSVVVRPVTGYDRKRAKQ